MKNISPQAYIDRVALAVTRIDHWQITKAVELIADVKKRCGMVFTMGNGGSAATAAHFANDLTKAADVKTLCLPFAVPISTAYMNDNGVENMFKDHLAKYHRPGDLIVAISCSGNSPNIVTALEANFGLSILMTGKERGAAEGHHTIRAYDGDIRVQEDVHSVICHAIVASLCDG